MPAIPSIASFTGASVTEGDFKTALSNLHLFLTGLLGTAGTQAGAQAAMGAILGAGSMTKTAAYTVDFTDRGKVIACDGSFTVTLPDAGSVGSGFAVAIANYGGGTITVDPFSAQTIDGAETKTLSANTMMVACAVAGEWLSVGGVDAASTSKAGIVQLVDSVVSTSQTLAPTANAVRAAYDTGAYAQTLANNAQNTANAAYNRAYSSVSVDVSTGVGAFLANMDSSARTVGGVYSASAIGAYDGSWRCTGSVVFFIVNAAQTVYISTFQRIS